jgi:hypothetical protein
VWRRTAAATDCLAAALGRHPLGNPDDTGCARRVAPSTGAAVTLPPGKSLMAPEEAASHVPNSLLVKSNSYNDLREPIRHTAESQRDQLTACGTPYRRVTMRHRSIR